MSAIASGLIGGLVAAALTGYIAKRVGRPEQAGRLYFSGFMWALAAACLLLALFPVAITVFYGHDRELVAKVLLFLGFLLAGLFCAGEAAFVGGTFNEQGIEFRTPWTGVKQERWRDLVSVEPNDWTSWYTLTFKSGKKIRLSRWLSGHLGALDAAGSRSEF